MKLYDYELSRLSRKAMGAPFTKLQKTEKLSAYRRRRAEFEARTTSRAHSRQLIILRRQGGIATFFINGRPVHPQSIAIAPRLLAALSLPVSIPQAASV